MNILDAEDMIKGLPDQALMQEAQMPSGQMPQFLVVSEIQRRSDMRKRYQAQQQEAMPSVKDQIVQEGIMGMMPQQPMGMPPQGMPQGMPPMGMAQGGIVRMEGGGFLDQLTAQGADPNSPFAGATIKDQIDRLLQSDMSYADVLAFISRTFPDRPEAISYLQARVSQDESIAPSASMGLSRMPEVREMLDREPYESKEARMPMLAGGSDIYKGPMVVRAADALGLFDRFKGEPEPERMAEPMASALARQVEDQYATPDLSERVTAEMLTGADPVPSRVPEGLPRPPRGPMANMLPPEYDRGVAERRAGIGEFFSDLSDQFAEGRARDREFVAGGYGRSFKPGLEPNPLDEAIEIAQQLHSDASGPRPPLLAAGNVVAPYDDYESVMNVIDGDAENVIDPDADMDFSVMDDYFSNLNAGDKAVQGNSPIQSQGKKEPSLGLEDLISDSRRMAQANALMQLGAGIAGGDLSKGISAAGVAASKGMQDARTLEMRKRLAEYQAGREDLAREEKSRQFEKTFGLSEDKLDALIAQNADLNTRARLKGLLELYEGALGEQREKYGAQIQAIIDSMGGGPMVVGGMQSGAVSFTDLARG